jgi:hypothetical protein
LSYILNANLNGKLDMDIRHTPSNHHTPSHPWAYSIPSDEHLSAISLLCVSPVPTEEKIPF